MLTDTEIDRLNKFLENKTFTYKGELIENSKFQVDLDYKFEIIGCRRMISVGEYYDYVSISLIMVNCRDKLSQLMFDSQDTKGSEFWTKFLNGHFFFFKYQMIEEIGNILINFDSDIRIVIDKFNVELPEKENIQEQKMTRGTIRNVVKDIVNILKTKSTGEYSLPDNDYGGGYDFSQFPVEFSVELYLEHTNSFNGYKLNAQYSSEDDVIEIKIIYNPSDLKTSLYDIVGELNEVVAHELEHSLQGYRGDYDGKRDEETDSLTYYLQPHEIPAQVAGFKRLSKLRRVPFESVVRDWFRTHTEIHGLTEDEREIVINKLLNYNKP